MLDKKVIAAQLYTVREFLKTPQDIGESLAKIKKIGYDAVQVSGMGPIDPMQLKDIVDALGLKICATHTPVERLTDDIKGVAEEHRLWGCDYVGIGSMPKEYRTSREGFSTFAKKFSKIAKEFADRGLRFVYHNHKFEFQKFDGITGMEILMNESDPETFQFEIDTYWVQAGGADPAKWIKKVKGRMEIVHLKDMAIIDDNQAFAEVGEGNLDWDAILKACTEAGVKWYAVEQDKCRCDPFDSLAVSLGNLLKMQA